MAARGKKQTIKQCLLREHTRSLQDVQDNVHTSLCTLRLS